MAGCFSKHLENFSEATFRDFGNPWNFLSLMLTDQETIIEWLQDQGLLLKEVECQKCCKLCRLSKRSSKLDGFTWRCTKNRNHEYSIHMNSFFSQSHFKLQDIMLFIKSCGRSFITEKCYVCWHGLQKNIGGLGKFHKRSIQGICGKNHESNDTCR